MYLCDGGEGVSIWGGFQGVKKDRRLQSLKIIKGSIFLIGSASKWNQENSYAPVKTS